MQFALIAICAAFVVGVTAFMVNRERDMGRGQALRFMAFALLGAGALASGWVAYVTVFAPPPVAEADLAPKQGTLALQVPSGRLEVVVHGNMNDIRSRHAGTGVYSVEAKGDDGKLLGAFDGKLDTHVETRRLMKHGVTNIEVKHLEGRHDVPPDWKGKHVTLAVTKEEGNLKGPMHVMVIPSPPSELALLIAGLVLAFAGGVLDRRVKPGAKSYVGVGVAFYFTFALLILESTRPLELRHLLAVVPMSLLLGAAVGGLAKVLVTPFVKPLPGPPVPASGR